MKNLLFVVWMLICFVNNAFTQIRKGDNSADIHFAVPIPNRLMNKYTEAINPDKRDRNFYDQAILKLPSSYTKAGKPIRLIYCAHGAGGGVTAKDWFINNFALVDSLLAHGYALFDVNGGESMENMGGPLVVYSAFQAYKTIRKNYNIGPKIFVLGLSMGGLSATNFCFTNPDLVLAQGLYSAVLDLHGQAWDHPWLPTTRKAISVSFNFDDKSGKCWEEDKVKGWNPLYAKNDIRGEDTLIHYPVPVAIWHGSGDAVVSVSASRAFLRYIQNGGGNCLLREIDSADHGLSCGNPILNHELMQFLGEF
jgi:pimeloyl-ACP methyl ester carboxylesterase